MAFSKAEKYVVLQLVNAVTHGITQSERVALRADLLDVMGLDEAKAAALLTEESRGEHTKAAEAAPTEDAPAADEATEATPSDG